MRNLKIVTTSWDDADPNDIRLADLLRSKGIAGTFYVPIKGYNAGKRLADCDLRMLCSDGFEIGAHGVSHKSLSGLNQKELRSEVRDCKHSLEHVLGEPVLMFCYPNGRYDVSVIRQVQQAGYKGARTTRMLSLRTDFVPFEMPTTLQAYPHRRVVYVRNSARARSIPGLIKCVTEYRRSQTWVQLGKRLFNRFLKNGGTWHLYGHSWEIEQLGIWSDLSDLLDHVSNREGVMYATNSQLLSLISGSGSVSQASKEVRQDHHAGQAQRTTS